MPHASLLGSNGHHSTFTSEMISGQINVFIVLWKKKVHPHTHHRRGMTLTHVCLHSCAHIAPRSKRNTTTHTGCLHILLALSHQCSCAEPHTSQSHTTKISAPSRGQNQTLCLSHWCIKALICLPSLKMFSAAWFFTTNDCLLKAFYWEKGHLQPQVCSPRIMSKA